MTTEVERFPLPAGVADAVLNKSQLARALAVSEPTIDRWVADGLPVLTAGTNGRSYEFQLSECFAWRKGREAEREAGNDAAERAVQEMRLALVDVLDGVLAAVRAGIEAMPDRLGRELSLTTPQVLVAVRLADDILDDLSKSLGKFVDQQRVKGEKVPA